MIEDFDVGVIVCGGKGERMGALTKSTQKCLLSVAGHPILSYSLNALAETGCKEIFLLVRYLADQIRDFAMRWRGTSRVEVVDSPSEVTAGALLALRKTIDRAFVYSHGDIIYRPGVVTELRSRYSNTKPLAMVALTSSDLAKTHAHASLEEGRITSLRIPYLNDSNPNARLCCMGVSIVSPDVFPYLERVRDTGMFEHALKIAKEQGKEIGGQIYYGEWFHMQTVEDFEAGQKLDVAKILRD